MQKKRAGLKAVLTQIAQSADRSSLFYWMVEHHDDLVARAKGRKLRWVELCVTFGTLGLTNQQGEIATERTARETWYRARKAVVRERPYAASMAATGLAPRDLVSPGPNRSRAPASWRPEQLPTQSGRHTVGASSPAQPARPQQETLATTLDTMPGVGGSVSEEVAMARLAAIRRELDERSGR